MFKFEAQIDYAALNDIYASLLLMLTLRRVAVFLLSSIYLRKRVFIMWP